MTTIAFSEGQMAADTQVTCGDLQYRATKLVRLPCGGVAGACGLLSEALKAFEWLKTGKGKPPKLKATSVLAAYADGRVGVYEDKDWLLLRLSGPVAVGSGAQAAMAAMVHFRASAADAVKAAAAVDPSTSEPVEVMRIEPAKSVKRRK
jgi:ATP-dependent protease HslVU (ClpYQ) peptidase subunit